MSENLKKKRRAFSLEEKMGILAQVDANVGKRVELAAALGIPVSTLNTIVRNREEIEKSFNSCGGSSSKARKSMKTSALDEMESILATWFKQARLANVFIDGRDLKKKALEMAARLGMDDFRASNGWIDRFKKRHNIVYRSLYSEGANINLEVVDEWKKEVSRLTEGYQAKDIFNADETGLFYNLQPSKSLPDKGDSYGTKTKQRITVFLCCNADGSEKLPPLVIGKLKNPHSFKNVKKLPIKYEANPNSCMTFEIFEEFLHELDSQMGACGRSILLFVDQCAAHRTNVNTLKNTKVIFFPASCTKYLQPLDMGIIHHFKCHYRKRLLHKAASMIEQGLIGDVSQVKINLLAAVNHVAEAWGQITPQTVENCFKKCGFLNYEGENLQVSEILQNEDMQDWDDVKPTGLNFIEYAKCEDHLRVHKVQSLDQERLQTTCDVEEEEKEEVGEAEEEEEESHKVSFFQALQGLETIRKYMQQFDVEESVLEKCDKLESELYSLKRREKYKQKL